MTNESLLIFLALTAVFLFCVYLVYKFVPASKAEKPIRWIYLPVAIIYVFLWLFAIVWSIAAVMVHSFPAAGIGGIAMAILYVNFPKCLR